MKLSDRLSKDIDKRWMSKDMDKRWIQLKEKIDERLKEV